MIINEYLQHKLAKKKNLFISKIKNLIDDDNIITYLISIKTLMTDLSISTL